MTVTFLFSLKEYINKTEENILSKTHQNKVHSSQRQPHNLINSKMQLNL